MFAAVIAASVLLFVVLNGGDDGGGHQGSATKATTSTGAERVELITVRGGEPVGGVRTLTYDKGDEVNIRVALDRPAESVHVHGYEIEKSAVTSPVNPSFTADLDGVFEIEVHEPGGADAEIAELEVNV